jgi:type 1 fimbria pilin
MGVKYMSIKTLFINHSLISVFFLICRLSFLACGLLFSSLSFAACYAPLMPVNMSLTNLIVPTNLPLGATIHGATTSYNVVSTCTSVSFGASHWLLTPSTSTLVSTGYPDVYATGKPGVGFRVSKGGIPLVQEWDGGRFALLVNNNPVNGDNILASTIELVKTGTITPGTSSFQWYLLVPNVGYANFNQGPSAVKLDFTISTITPSCSVTSVPSVTLPVVPKSAFKNGDGSLGPGTTFKLTLNCEATAQPSISFSDNTLPTNNTDRLTLTGDSTAAGVKLQLTYNGNPVSFVPNAFSPGSNTVISPTPSSTPATTNVPFGVRYIQDGSSITPGLVKGIATFTATYK